MSMPKLLFYLHIDQIFKEGKFFKESLTFGWDRGPQ